MRLVRKIPLSLSLFLPIRGSFIKTFWRGISGTKSEEKEKEGEFFCFRPGKKPFFFTAAGDKA